MSGKTIEKSRVSVIEFLAATMLQAHRSAELVAQYLERIGLVPGRRQRMKRPVILPAAFLLQIAAAIRLREWELSGVAQQPLAGLPSSEDVLASAFDFLRAFSTGAAQDEPAPSVSGQVFAVWYRYFALTAPRDLGVNVIIGGKPPDDAMVLIADFIWKFRHLAQEKN
jgi:hypothetical protein